MRWLYGLRAALMLGARKMLEMQEASNREQFDALRNDSRDREQRLQIAIKDAADRSTSIQLAHQVDNQRRFDKIEVAFEKLQIQVSSLSVKIAIIVGGIAMIGWGVEHFHLLSKL
jgi:hypothetical protein